MLLNIIVFLIGIIILLISTQKFVSIAQKLSQVLKISPLIIGITVVAIGTSLPELAVSLVSASKNDIGLAMGNIIGSNITNILFILPIGILIGKMRLGTTKTQRNAIILLFITIIFVILQYFNIANIIVGFILIVLALLVTIIEYSDGVKGRENEDIKQFRTKSEIKFDFLDFIQCILLIVGIVFGSILVVNSVETIAIKTGLTTTILGLTLTAIATSLPELLTTIFSQKDNQEKITVGNILGSNIYNLLLIGGIIMFFPSNIIIATKEWIWLIFTTLILLLILREYKGKKPPIWIGFTLIILFIFFLISQ